MHRLSIIVGVFAAATACSSSTTPTAPSTPVTASITVNAFHGEITDGAGDAVASATVPTPPDLIQGTLDVADGNLKITFKFAPGTLSASTVVTILLDTDQNPATGYS